MLVADWYPTSVDRQGKGVMLAASHSLKIVEIRTKRDDWRRVDITVIRASNWFANWALLWPNRGCRACSVALVASRGRLTFQRAWPRHGNEADTRAHRGAVPRQPDVSVPDVPSVSRG